MAASSPWPTIHQERAALLADLEGLPQDQWLTPSLCIGWNVQQVLGHLTASASMTPLGFFGKMIAAGFNFTKMANKDVAANASGTPAETMRRFRAKLNSSTSPPGPVDSWLGEAVIHAEDIRQPLGIKHAYPIDAVVRVANFYKGSNLIVGAKKRIDGLTLKASDSDFTTGTGPEVVGPTLLLVMAMTGRPYATAELAGPGVSTLAGRMT